MKKNYNTPEFQLLALELGDTTCYTSGGEFVGDAFSGTTPDGDEV